MAKKADEGRDLFLESVQVALRRMDKAFTDLSGIHFDQIHDDLFLEMLKKEKVQERPFAYEFYHQFRKYWDCGAVALLGFGNTVVQAEVNKFYQNIPGLKKAPDFLVHRVGTLQGQDQLAVIEFKLAENVAGVKRDSTSNVMYTEVQYDFEKLSVFRHKLRYQYGIEVVPGRSKELRIARAHINKLCKPTTATEGNHLIHVVYFDTEERSTTMEAVLYPK